MTGARLLLAGATGAVGQEVLQQALADPQVGEVVALTRKPLASAPKLRNVVVDFSALPDGDHWAVDAVICALGTTIRVAGSKAAFAAVDRDLPIEIGHRARAAGARAYALNSSLGANPKSGNFYLRTKGEAEDGVRALEFSSLVIVRPSLIDAQRSEPRPGEQITLALTRPLRGLIPPRWRPVTAAAIAQALLNGALGEKPGVEIVESDRL